MTEPVLNLECLEAEARELMALHAAIAPRGFQSARERAYYHALIDALLDRWLLISAFNDTSDLDPV